MRKIKKMGKWIIIIAILGGAGYFFFGTKKGKQICAKLKDPTLDFTKFPTDGKTK